MTEEQTNLIEFQYLEGIASIKRLDNNAEYIPFKGKTPPTISITEYAHRIITLTHAPSYVYNVATYYIYKLQQIIPVMSLNIHRILLASLLIASKLYEDEYLDNESYAKIGGISVREMNTLELCMMTCLDFCLFVGEKELEEFNRMHSTARVAK